MNDYIVTQRDVELLMQSNKTIYYKLELLNEKFQVVDLLEGNLISDNISISSESDVRRTYSCQLVVTDSSFVLERESKIWFDKKIRPYIGILHQRTNEIIWYLLGTFLFTDLNYSYDVTSKTLSITCLDMMCLLNDSRKGVMPDYKRTILAGTSSRAVIISLLEELGITKYFIEFNINNNVVSTFEIPYDMVYAANSNVYTVIKDIISLYPGTQMYFDLNGTFIISTVPTRNEEINVLTDDIIQPILIDEQITTSLSNVYNHIKIWGKVNEPDYYIKNVNVSNNVYNASLIMTKLDEDTNETIEVPYEEYENFDIFAIRVPSTNNENQRISINGLESKLIVNSDGGSLESGYFESNVDYVFRYRVESDDFLYLGQYQVYGEAYLTNIKDDKNEYAVIREDNDFSIEKIGDILKVFTGGEYDLIYTNQLANMRARYELNYYTNKQDTLVITTIFIPWLDVNMKIEFTSNLTKETCEYLITSISCDYSTGQMTINLNRYYPEYTK